MQIVLLLRCSPHDPSLLPPSSSRQCRVLTYPQRSTCPPSVKILQPLAAASIHLETRDRNSHSEVTASPGHSLLRRALETSLVLQVVDTLSDGLAVGGTLRDGLLPVSSSDSHSVDEVALLGLVAQSPSLVRSRGSRSSVDDGELSVLPASHSGHELEHVRLLFGVELAQVLVGSPGRQCWTQEWYGGLAHMLNAP